MPRAPSGARGATLSPVPDITAAMERSEAEHRFGVLFDTHRRLVLGYALRRVDEPADAADVVAETFLVAWRRLGDVPEGEAARGWLLGVARRVLANHRRGERRRDGLADRLARELVAVPVERDGREVVWRALAQLSDEDRELLLLAGWEGLAPGRDRQGHRDARRHRAQPPAPGAAPAARRAHRPRLGGRPSHRPHFSSGDRGMSLDDLVRRADPIRDEPLEFDDAFEALREEIVARPVIARTRPPRRRRWLVPPAVAVVASAVALMVFFLPGDGGTDRAWAAPLVRIAESVPRLLVGDWKVTRADQFALGEGEMTFEDGSRTVQLSWRKGGDPIQKDGIIGWEQQGYALELRGEAAAEARAELRAVSIDEWLGAMPASVVRPVESEQVVDQMLGDLPLPPGFDRATLDTGGMPRDRYQLGSRVVAAVACGWIETWIDGRAEGTRRSGRRPQDGPQLGRPEGDGA